MKKIISVFLSLIMLLSITTGAELSAYAETSGNYEYDLFDNGIVEITQYTGDDKEVVVPSMIEGYVVTSIGSFAFDGCKNLTSVTIGDGVTRIRHEAFWNCFNLMSVTIPYSITSIGDAVFECCENLKDIYYSSTINDWNEISIGYDNEYFTTATIHCTDGVIQNLQSSGSGDYEYDFIDDDYIQITKYNGNNTDIVIPEMIDSYIVKEIGEHAFYELTEEGDKGYDFITSVYIPDTVDTIYNGAFADCKSLKSVRLSANLKYLYNWVFQDDIGLTDIILPEKLEYIGMTCFSGCENLTSINIPKNVTHIGSWAFQDCLSLSDVYYGSSKEDWNKFLTGEYLIGGCNECLLNATIHYTDGVINEKIQPSAPTEPITPTEPSSSTISTQPTEPTSPSVNVLITEPIQPATTVKEKSPAGATKVNGEWVAKKQKNTKIKKLTKGKKSFKVTLSKVSGIAGYQIQYSTSKKFSKKTTKAVTIKNNKTTSKTIKKLKAKKKYYVRIRTYKTVKVNGKNTKVYSSWSKVKTVTTKK